MVNLVICGTPGTGKSTLVDKLVPKAATIGMINVINISKFAVQHNCTSGYDDELGCHIIDEDKLDSVIESHLGEGDRLNVIESIHADIIDPKLIDFVFACRTDNTILFDRLSKRGYSEDKIANNIQAEIFQTIYDEALEAFGESLVEQLQSNVTEDLERNVDIVMRRLSDLMKKERG